MPTKGERQALLFLAAVAMLGAGTRACRAHQAAPSTVALDRQIDAVEAPAGSRRGRGTGPKAAGRKRGRGSRRDTSVAQPGSASTLRLETIVTPTQRLDLDTAKPDDIDRLPGVGPSLAKRIVENRDAGGTFGCLAALDGVKGVGPSILRRLDSLVTFSGSQRPICSQR